MLPGLALMVNDPSEIVVAVIEVLITLIVAPERGIPVDVVTIPVTFSCPRTELADKRQAIINAPMHFCIKQVDKWTGIGSLRKLIILMNDFLIPPLISGLYNNLGH